MKCCQERENVMLSHPPWHILLPIPVKKTVWCSWQTVWRSLFFRFLIKVCPHYLCFGSDLSFSSCLFKYVDGFMSLNPRHTISQHPGLEQNRGSTRYAVWPINIKCSQKNNGVWVEKKLILMCQSWNEKWIVCWWYCVAKFEFRRNLMGGNGWHKQGSTVDMQKCQLFVW